MQAKKDEGAAAAASANDEAEPAKRVFFAIIKFEKETLS